jgi:hypothetical protein
MTTCTQRWVVWQPSVSVWAWELAGGAAQEWRRLGAVAGSVCAGGCSSSQARTTNAMMAPCMTSHTQHPLETDAFLKSHTSLLWLPAKAE